jgi:hypothetical protein
MRIHSLLVAGLLMAGTCASAQTLQRFIIAPATARAAH